MKKFVVLLIIATITLIGISGLLFYQLNVVQTENNELIEELIEVENQREELKEQLNTAMNRVKITKFKIYGGINPIGGLQHFSYANITIENFGVNPVEGLTLSLYTISTYGDEDLNKEISVEVLEVADEMKINTTVFYGFAYIEGTSSFKARLMLGDEILSEDISSLY